MTLQEQFKSGMKSGEFPHAENTMKAIRAVTRKDTEPHVRAYWSGYLCKLTSRQIDDACSP
jgi:translation initiation factor 2B subunit (eIF-2B alpha/beta/delta family)